MTDFSGFSDPEGFFTRLPHSFIDTLPDLTTLAELKVVLYILRHTWGFGDYDKPKRITTDEFMLGRKQKDRSRMDRGTGLSKQAVIDGLAIAEAHRFITVEWDTHDAARKHKSYCLTTAGSKALTSVVKTLYLDQRKKLWIETNRENQKNCPPFSDGKTTGVGAPVERHPEDDDPLAEDLFFRYGKGCAG